MASETTTPRDVIDFWRDAGFKRWFSKDDAFDAAIRERFGQLHQAATRGELNHWSGDPHGALALVLLLDQFSRNLYRGDPRTYAADDQARALCERALEAGFDRQVEPELSLFFHVPFLHSERLSDQERAVQLFEQRARENGLGEGDQSLKSAREHRDIIQRFGRFPHRNAILGRESTAEELAFLASGGFAG